MAEDASAGRVKAVEEDSAKGRKRVGMEEEEEEKHYYKKIKKLARQKTKLLVEKESKPKSKTPTENEQKTKMNTKPVVISNPQDHHVSLPKKVVVKTETKKLKHPITQHQKKKKKKKAIVRTRMPLVSNNVTEQLKQLITNEMNGGEVKVVIQKRLYPSDLKEDQNRLNIPINQLQTHDFLTEEERRQVENGKGLEVELLGPRLVMHEKPMVLTIWHLKSSDNFVLKKNWNEFVRENKEDLKVDTMIQVWSFRRHNQLCFALTCLGRNVDHQNNAVVAAPVN